MSRDFEVEEGREVVRRTIVGGRPRAREKRRIRVPIGLEKVLCRAAGDPRFRAALLADRGAAVEASGFELLASERAVLDSVPASVLASMIARIDVRKHGRGRFMRGVLAATFATAVIASQGCGEAQSAGARVDVPLPSDTVDVQQAMADVGVTVSDDVDPSRGISPDEPDVLIMPDLNADEGMRPDIVFGPDVLVEPDVMADGGVRPDLDVVYTDEAVPLGILPDTE